MFFQAIVCVCICVCTVLCVCVWILCLQCMCTVMCSYVCVCVCILCVKCICAVMCISVCVCVCVCVCVWRGSFERVLSGRAPLALFQELTSGMDMLFCLSRMSDGLAYFRN